MLVSYGGIVHHLLFGFKREFRVLLPVVLLGVAVAISAGFIFGLRALTGSSIVATPTPAPSPIPAPAPQPAPEIPADWQTYRNEEFGFEVKYPRGYEIQGTGRPGEPTEGRESSPGYIHIADESPSPDKRIMISTPLTNDVSRNPEATTLSDYHSDYKAAYFDVIIHSQEERTINNILTLKQNYSAGEWKDDGTFDATSEYAENRVYRYVFVDQDKDAFILKGDDEALLDVIAQTFKFLR